LLATEPRTERKARVTEKDIKALVREMQALPETLNLDFHIVDPKELLPPEGVVEFERPVPLRHVVQISPDSREIFVVVNTNKMRLLRLEFGGGDSMYRTKATFLVSDSEGWETEIKYNYITTVEGLTLLFHDALYKELKEGRARISGNELENLVNFVDASIKELVRSGEHRLITPRDTFRNYNETTRVGSSDIFIFKDWCRIAFVTDFTGPDNEEYIGIEMARPRYTESGVYVTLLDRFQKIVNIIGIGAVKAAPYKIEPSRLAKLPVAPILLKLKNDGVKLLNDYLELSKLVFLGVRAYVS